MSDYIPEDTVALILKCLPVRSLLRFRSVCKGWKVIIDSPTFLHDHLSLQNPRFIVNWQRHKFLSVDPHICRPFVDALIPPIVSDQIGLLGTLHGVVCITDWERQFVIWNPSIRKSSVVALPDEFRREDYGGGWQDFYGFWIDPCTKEFKVLVLLFLHGYGHNCVIQDNHGILYSSIQNDWRVIPLEDLRDWQPHYGGTAPVVIGEVAHWAGWYVLDDEGYGPMAEAIMCFDFRLESFEFIEIPSNFHRFRPRACCWQGMLSLLCCDDTLAPCRWEIYSRQEGNSWVKVFGLDLLAPTNRVFWPLTDMGEMQENCRGLAIVEDELVICDTKTGCINPLSSELQKPYPVTIAYDFVESLLFP